MIKGVHIGKNIVEVVEIKGDLDSLYKVTKCDCIDITSRKIDGKWFDFVCDDEGLFKEEIFCTVHSAEYGPSIVNDVFICGADWGKGELTSLSDDDIQLILSRVVGTIIVVD